MTWKWEGSEGEEGRVIGDTFSADELIWTLTAIAELAESGQAALDLLPEDEAWDSSHAILQAIKLLARSQHGFLNLPTTEMIDLWREGLRREGEKLLKKAEEES